MANIFKAKSLISRTGVFSNEVIAPNLVYNTGDQNVSGIKSFYSRPNVNGTGVLLSGEAASLPTTIVYTTGNQTISGIKTFANNLEVQGTGIFNALDLSNISEFNFSGTNINLISGNVNISGQIYISGNPVLTGVDLSSYASDANLASTGNSLNNSITSLSGLFTGYTGNVDSTFASDTQLFNTGSTLDNKINALSGVTVLTYANQNISGNKTFTNNVEIISSVSGMYGTGNLLNALNVRGFASVNADLSSLTGLITISGSGISGTSPGQFSVGGLLIGQNEGGGYLGRTNIRENSWEVVSGSIANIWISGETDRNWRDIAMSSDGKIQTALASDVVFSTPGKIYISNDYGKIWKEINILNQWEGIAMSSDGKIQTAITSDNTYVSHNYGVDWEIKPSGVGGFDISVSSDGRIQGVVKGYNAYISYDYGNTWNIKSPNVIASSVNIKLSSDGRIQVINGSDGFYGVGDWGYIHISYDYGNTWKQLNTEVGAIYRDIAISADGRIIAAAHINGPISMSYDYGTTWINKATNITISHIYGITMSADGRTIVAAIHNSAIPTNKIYISTDYGNTWQYKSDLYANGNDRTQSIAMSSDGRIITNVYDYGKIWTSYASTLSPNSINVLGSITAHDNVNISGNLNVTGNILLSGNPVLTGVDLSSYATTANLALTGLNLSNNISSLSGLFTGYTGNLDSTFATDIQLQNTGSTLSQNINSLSGTLTNDYYLKSNPSGFITGVDLSSYLTSSTASSTYATITNLANTGSNLVSSINSFSWLFTGFTGNLDATYATDIQLLNTGITLNNSINSLSGVSVLTYGNQSITGNKTFINNITVSGTGTFNAIDLDNIDNLSLSGVDVTLTNSIVNVAGNIFISGNPVLTGVDLTPYATTSNLALTGLNLSNNINSLSGLFTGYTGNLDSTFASDIQLANTGSTLDTKIDNLSGYVTGANATFASITNLANTGSTLNTNINNLSGYINSTDSNIVFTTGNQSVAGNKTLTNKLNITVGASNDSALKVGTLEFQPYSVNNAWLGDNTYYNAGFYRREAGYAGAFYFQGPEGQFRFADTADAGTFYTPAVQLKTHLDGRFGVGSDISTATDNFTNSNFFVDSNGNVGINTLTPSEKLEVVGNIIGNNLVYNTGDQTISGIKTFATGVNINGHVGIGINNNNFNLYVRKSPAGVTVSPDVNSIAVFEGSGNSHITVLASNAQSAGVVLGSPADNFGAYLTWNYDNNALKLGTDKPGSFIQLLTDDEAEAVRITSGANVGIGTTSPSEKLQVVGNILANNLVYNTGNQTISGIKTFSSVPTVNGTGVLLSGNAAPQDIATTINISSNTISLDLSAFSYFLINLNNNITTTNFNNPKAAPEVTNFVLQLSGDGTIRSVAWPTSLRWPGSTAPTITIGPNKVDTYSIFSYDGGVSYYGFPAGYNS